MKKRMTQLTLVLLSFVVLAACGKKSDNSTAVNGINGNIAPGPSNLPYGQASTAGTVTTYITASPQYQDQFTEAVKVLVSATIDPNSIGTVSPQNGVQMRARVSVDRNSGAVVMNANSLIELRITDSYSLSSSNVPPVDIQIPMIRGTAANGQANITFSDAYGSVTVAGTYDAQNFHGTVSFVNAKPGFNNKASGTLGDFQLPTCAFFVCQ